MPKAVPLQLVMFYFILFYFSLYYFISYHMFIQIFIYMLYKHLAGLPLYKVQKWLFKYLPPYILYTRNTGQCTTIHYNRGIGHVKWPELNILRKLFIL